MGLSGRRRKVRPSSTGAGHTNSVAGLEGPGQSMRSRPKPLGEWVGRGKQSVRIPTKQSGVQDKASVPAEKYGAE